jgi:uncharacterized membrane protein YhaH (DUF805 family)
MSNRIGRLEFLFWCVASILAGAVVLAIVSVVTNIQFQPGRTPHWSQALVLIAVAVVLLKAQVSRFHDVGWSGRAVLLMFIPLVNVVAFLLLLVVPGQKRPNRYGERTIFLQGLRKAGDRQITNTVNTGDTETS